MRNGDFLPTRLQAQQDAVGMITQAKLRANPEANVGLLSLADLDVLVTLTTDTGKVLAKLHAVQPKGQIKLVPGKLILRNTYFHSAVTSVITPRLK
jgi:26S proteasome regulatory subunit N10